MEGHKSFQGFKVINSSQVRGYFSANQMNVSFKIFNLGNSCALKCREIQALILLGNDLRGNNLYTSFVKL